MIREEAITKLHWLKAELIKGTDLNEPIDMAIEALTYQNLSKPNNTCEDDLIRREDAIDAVLELNTDGRVSWKDAVIDMLDALSSATGDDCIWHVCNYNKIDWDGEDGYISRQDAIKPFCIAPDGTRIPEVDCDNFPVEFSVEFIKKHLLSLPSAEPKTGEWVMLERVENVHDIYGVPTWGVNYMCDKCGFIHTAIQNHFSQYKYCPNCGARMKGADDEREDIQSTDE